MTGVEEVFGAAAPKDPGRWLNSAPVVDQIVRQFFKRVLDKVGDRDLMGVLEFETRRMNGLFLGYTPVDSFERGPWNDPDHLGVFLLKELQIKGNSTQAVRDAFMIYAGKLIELASKASHESGDRWQKDLDALVARLRNALIGIPAEALS